MASRADKLKAPLKGAAMRLGGAWVKKNRRGGLPAWVPYNAPMSNKLLQIACSILGIISVFCVVFGVNSHSAYLSTYKAYNEAVQEEDSLRQQVTDANNKWLDEEEMVNDRDNQITQLNQTISDLTVKVRDTAQRLTESLNREEALEQEAGKKAAANVHSFTTADGRVFSVSDADYNRLAPIKADLDNQYRALDAREADIAARMRVHNSFQIDNTNPYEVDSYNTQGQKLDAMAEALKEDNALYNSRVDTFNTELARVGTQVKQ